MSILLDAGCCCPEDDDPKPGEGTCCLPGNICAEGFSQIGCEAAGGEYLGDDAECDNLPAGVCGTGTSCTDPPLDCTPVFPSCVQFNATITIQHLHTNFIPTHPCNKVIGNSCTAVVSELSFPSTGCNYGHDDLCPPKQPFCGEPCCCEVVGGAFTCAFVRILRIDVTCEENGTQFNPDPHFQAIVDDQHFNEHVFIKNLGNGPAGGYTWLGCPFNAGGFPGGASGCGNLGKGDGSDDGPFWDITSASLTVGTPGSCSVPALAPPPIIGRLM